MRTALRVLLFVSIPLAWVGAATPLLHGQKTPADPTRVAIMRGHYQGAMVVHSAVIRGDMPALQSAARGLAEYEPPPGSPDTSKAYVQAIRDAAAKISNAPTIVSAAYSTAGMLSACGNCHRALGTMPAAPLTAPPKVGGVVGHMLAHQRAADQLLQGLIVPSDSSWREGARAFAAAPLHADDLPAAVAEARALILNEDSIHRIATAAAQASNSLNRAGYYGQILAGCAECHKSHAKIWGPKP